MARHAGNTSGDVNGLMGRIEARFKSSSQLPNADGRDDRNTQARTMKDDKDKQFGTAYADDALLVDGDTSLDEVQDFIRRRVDSPHIIDGTVIWNFSSHEVDEDALETAVDRKLERDKYVIPYQVTGTWSFMFSILPKQLREAEILVYKTSSGRYNAYRNFLRTAPDEVHETFRSDMGQRVHEVLKRV